MEDCRVTWKSDIPLRMFSSLHWDLETKFNICTEIQTPLSKSSDAHPAPEFASLIVVQSLKPNIPQKKNQPQKNQTSKKTPLLFLWGSKQPFLFTVVVGRSSGVFPVPNLTSVFWRTDWNSLPKEWSSWLSIPRCWIIMQRAGKTYLWVWPKMPFNVEYFSATLFRKPSSLL